MKNIQKGECVRRREILETTRAECRAEKITLAQSHRRVADKVLHILYLKAFVGQLRRYHTRVRAYFVSPMSLPRLSPVTGRI